MRRRISAQRTIASRSRSGKRAYAPAHAIARELAIGRRPASDDLPYDVPGDAAATRDELLAGIDAAEARAADTRILAGGGPTYPHATFGELTARGWLLFAAVHH